MEKASTNALARLTLRNCATITMAKTMNSRTINQLVYTRRRVNPYCWSIRPLAQSRHNQQKGFRGEQYREHDQRAHRFFSLFHGEQAHASQHRQIDHRHPAELKKPWRAYSA